MSDKNIIHEIEVHRTIMDSIGNLSWSKSIEAHANSRELAEELMRRRSYKQEAIYAVLNELIRSLDASEKAKQ
jgi:hypothetical protein